MKLILGIGNPGVRYLDTRHNVGFQVLDNFCDKHNLNFRAGKGEFWSVESILNTFHFFLIKPSSYVNNSGIVVSKLLNNLELDLNNLLVLCDDTNLEVGKIRIRKSGSDGGHNGLKSIIYHLESDEFPRIRIGVGSPKENENLADYVLSPFPKDDDKIVKDKFSLVTELIEQFIIGDLDNMLNFYSTQGNQNISNIS